MGFELRTGRPHGSNGLSPLHRTETSVRSNRGKQPPENNLKNNTEATQDQTPKTPAPKAKEPKGKRRQTARVAKVPKVES